jgi:hypothetical protein
VTRSGALDLGAFSAAHRADGNGRAAYEPSIMAWSQPVVATRCGYSKGRKRRLGMRLSSWRLAVALTVGWDLDAIREFLDTDLKWHGGVPPALATIASKRWRSCAGRAAVAASASSLMSSTLVTRSS